MNKQRDDFIDFIKSVAIVLVVLGHSIQYGNGADYLASGDFFDNQIFKWIYGLHMPLFMVVSGHLFKKAIGYKCVGEIVKDRFRSLLVPIFLWGVVEFVIELVVRGSPNGYGATQLIKRLGFHIVFGLWFLWAVFYCSIAVSIIYRRLRNSLIAYAALIGVMFFTPDAYNFQTYKFMFLYFALPVAFHKIDAREWLARRTNLQLGFMMSISFAAYWGVMGFWGRDFYIYTTGFSILTKDAVTQIFIDAIRWGAGLIGIAAVLALLQLSINIMPRLAAKLSFRIMGRQSLGIYVLSGLMISYPVQLATQKYSYSLATTLMICAIVTLASLALSYGISKFPLLNLTLFGRRSS